MQIVNLLVLFFLGNFSLWEKWLIISCTHPEVYMYLGQRGSDLWHEFHQVQPSDTPPAADAPVAVKEPSLWKRLSYAFVTKED